MNILSKKIEIPKLIKKIIFYISLLGFGLCFIYFLVIPIFPLLLFPCIKCTALDGMLAWIKYAGLPLSFFIGILFSIFTNRRLSFLTNSIDLLNLNCGVYDFLVLDEFTGC